MTKQLELLDPKNFVEELAKKNGVPLDGLLVRYLERKTRAATRGAKARRSLGNVYAILVLAEDFLEGKEDGSRFTDLLARMKALPFGSKLQNHPLDNRLNDEFRRQMGVDENLLPVQSTIVDGAKARRISPELLSHNGLDPLTAAAFIVEVIHHYIALITEKQSSYLEDIAAIGNSDELVEFLSGAFEPNSDARLFEVVSYILVAEHFRGQSVWVGPSKSDLREVPFRLFRSGRTNANDGGIDFVLTPIGKFYQVTESLEFSKYFLDFEKVNRFPLSFVVKVETSSDTARKQIRRAASASGRYSAEQIDLYMGLFDEVLTLPDLRRLLNDLPKDEAALDRVKAELTLQFSLEYGLLD